jgi:hypothetical protein
MKLPVLLGSAFLVLASSCQPRPVEEFPIGVLVDATSPARANFTAAAELAASQLNQGLESAASHLRIKVVVGAYGTGQARAVAIDLVNNQGVRALVSDISGNTAAVNGLNYETPRPINRQVAVTCYQCSSAFFNDPAQTNPGFADPDNWLYRTFFNATFESAVQVQLVLNKPSQGDFDGDGHLRIAVYYDTFHLSAATTMPAIIDSLHSGPHSVHLVAKTLPSTPETRAAEMASLLDSAGEGPRPDAVYLAFLPQNAPEALTDYRAQATAIPVQANNGVRRDFLLATLLASGGQGLEGSSVQVVADSQSGRAFARTFQDRTGAAPELTASFLYDAVAVHGLAVQVATAAGQRLAELSDEALRAGLGTLNDPQGKLIPATPPGFLQAALRIKLGQAINYDGASSAVDLTAVGEMYPALVHWRIEDGRFVELETYRCDPENPNCAREAAGSASAVRRRPPAPIVSVPVRR